MLAGAQHTQHTGFGFGCSCWVCSCQIVMCCSVDELSRCIWDREGRNGLINLWTAQRWVDDQCTCSKRDVLRKGRWLSTGKWSGECQLEKVTDAVGRSSTLDLSGGSLAFSPLRHLPSPTCVTSFVAADTLRGYANSPGLRNRAEGEVFISCPRKTSRRRPNARIGSRLHV